MGFDLANMEVQETSEAEQNVSSGGSGRKSDYEPIAQKWSEIDDGKAIYLSDLSNADVQNIRNLVYRRFGKENVIVRSSKVGTNEDGNDVYDAVLREREGGEYLRDNGESSDTDSEPESEVESEEDLDDVF